MKIKALLLDFGGVLYDIDPMQTIKKFKELSIANSKFRSLDAVNYETLPFLAEYERGQISTDKFRKAAAEILGISPRYEIDAAWNETLQGIKANMDKVIQELAENYPLFLLSNTNELHHKQFEEECKMIFTEFKHCFYSYKMKLQKPDPEIFKVILKNIGFSAEELLFVDDSIENIKVAEMLGFNVYHIDNKQNSIYNLSDYLHSVNTLPQQNL